MKYICSKDPNIDSTGSINILWNKIHDAIKEASVEVSLSLNNFSVLFSRKGDLTFSLHAWLC